MAFNPLATSAFDNSFFVIPEGTHRFKITGSKLRKQKWGAGEAYLLDISTRVENGNAETNGKQVNVSSAIATYDPSIQSAATDEEGNPVVDMRQQSQIAHAALGYENGLKSEDDRFKRDRGAEDFSVDFETFEMHPSWKELEGCSFIADVTHQQDKKDPNKVYPRFNKIRSVK